MEGQEQRLFPRQQIGDGSAAVCYRAIVEGPEPRELSLRPLNISLGGLAARCDCALEPGTRVTVLFPAQADLMEDSCSGTVLRCHAIEEEFEIAIQWSSLMPKPSGKVPPARVQLASFDYSIVATFALVLLLGGLVAFVIGRTLATASARDAASQPAEQEARSTSPAHSESTSTAASADDAVVSNRPVAVAEDATILVSSGGPAPILLGDAQPLNSQCTLHVWDWSQGQQSRPLAVETRSSLAVSPDGKWIVTQEGNVVQVSGGQIRRVEALASSGDGMCFSPDGGKLLVLSDTDGSTTARVLDFPSGKVRCQIEGQWARPLIGQFSPDGGEVFLADENGTICRHDARSGAELARLEPALATVSAIALSDDGKRLAAADGPARLYVWDSESGTLVQNWAPQPQRPLGAVTCLRFSPDGKQLATAGTQSIALIDAADGNISRLWPSAVAHPLALRFSADSATLTVIYQNHLTRGPAGMLLIYPSVQQLSLKAP